MVCPVPLRDKPCPLLPSFYIGKLIFLLLPACALSALSAEVAAVAPLLFSPLPFLPITHWLNYTQTLSLHGMTIPLCLSPATSSWDSLPCQWPPFRGLSATASHQPGVVGPGCPSWFAARCHPSGNCSVLSRPLTQQTVTSISNNKRRRGKFAGVSLLKTASVKSNRQTV